MSRLLILFILSAPAMGAALEYSINHAREMFRLGKYNQTIALLGPDISSYEAKWLKAESLLALREYKSARDIYKLLFDIHGEHNQSKKLAALRIIECDLQLRDVSAALSAYNYYQDSYKSVPDFINYGLAKLLFDYKYYQNAVNILRKIDLNSVYGMRAHYILGAIQLDNWSNTEAVEHFTRTAAMTPMSVEDFTVLDAARMARARIYSDAHDFLSALKAYNEVPKSSAYAEQATQELAAVMLFWADSLVNKKYLTKDAIGFALAAMERYQNNKPLNLQDPELAIQMGRLYTKTGRYQEAKIALNNLIGYYNKLLSEPQSWSYQDLPRRLKAKLPDLSPLFALKNRLDIISAQLITLKERNADISELAKYQKILELEYQELLRLAHNNISQDFAPIINKIIAEAQFRLGETSMQEMQDLRKQLDAVGKFQTEKIMNFEKNMAEIGGST